MTRKGKGKIHPSPSSSRSVSGGDFSFLNILPAAILAVIAVLSLEDREVLAYMITRSMSAGTSSSSISVQESKKQRNGSKNETESKKKSKKKKQTASAIHAPPVFDCGCFDCYTCYWDRWDSSPNREIIDLAMEAFEDRLRTGNCGITNNDKKGKKSGRGVANRTDAGKQSSSVTVAGAEGSTVDKVSPATPSEGIEAAGENDAAVVIGNRGLARMVLPDVLVMFNSRLWGLWNPNA